LPLKEKTLIERIRKRSSSAPPIVTGIGDDTAVLRIPHGHEALITTDFSLEGVHFRREWHPAEVVGHRCLTRGLSDIAAMGGKPIAAFLSLAIPGSLPQSWVDNFLRGLLKLADKSRVPLAGGDTAQSPNGVLADIVVLGSAPRGRAILRSGAKPGDQIYVTGELGGSAAALNLLFSGRTLRHHDYPHHFCPTPRLEVGQFLSAHKIASAMIDISDGLSTDLTHICEESAVGAHIEADSIPLARIGRPTRPVDLKSALHGGDDYELLFTAPRHKRVPSRIAAVPITQIGHINKSKRIVLSKAGTETELKPQGWQHFQ